MHLIRWVLDIPLKEILKIISHTNKQEIILLMQFNNGEKQLEFNHLFW